MLHLSNALMQTPRPGALWSLRGLHKVNIIHKAMVPPGGGPVHCGPLRRRANIGPAGPAAQNNTPPPERTTSFLLPAGEERRRGGEEEERRGGDPFTETGHQNVGLCDH